MLCIVEIVDRERCLFPIFGCFVPNAFLSLSPSLTLQRMMYFTRPRFDAYRSRGRNSLSVWFVQFRELCFYFFRCSFLNEESPDFRSCSPSCWDCTRIDTRLLACGLFLRKSVGSREYPIQNRSRCWNFLTNDIDW